MAGIQRKPYPTLFLHAASLGPEPPMITPSAPTPKAEPPKVEPAKAEPPELLDLPEFNVARLDVSVIPALMVAATPTTIQPPSRLLAATVRLKIIIADQATKIDQNLLMEIVSNKDFDMSLRETAGQKAVAQARTESELLSITRMADDSMPRTREAADVRIRQLHAEELKKSFTDRAREVERTATKSPTLARIAVTKLLSAFAFAGSR